MTLSARATFAKGAGIYTRDLRVAAARGGPVTALFRIPESVTIVIGNNWREIACFPAARRTRGRRIGSGGFALSALNIGIAR